MLSYDSGGTSYAAAPATGALWYYYYALAVVAMIAGVAACGVAGGAL